MDYKILPYRFERFDNEVFISSEVGEYLYLSSNEFESFVKHPCNLVQKVIRH